MEGNAKEDDEKSQKTVVLNEEAEEEGHKFFSFKQKEDEGEKPMLEPDHPLLEKFQRALKEHLQRQIEHLRGEVFELETATKKKDAEREALGVEVYEAQQLVTQQQEVIENYVVQLDMVTAQREELENDLEKSYETYKEKRESLFEAERKEIELRKEIEAMNVLTHQMTKWEHDVESELSMNQRISEKTKKEKMRLAEEKRTQDMFIYNLMNEIWRIEGELETMDMQLRVKEEEREKLAEAVAGYNTDLEAVEAEYRCLLHSWNSVIVTIGTRDKHYNALNQELQDNEEKLRSMEAEKEQTKKLCNKEMMQNERLTLIKSRVDNEIKAAQTQMQDETHKRLMLEKQANDIQAIIDQTEKDIQKAALENNQKSTALRLATREFERLTQEKVGIEEKILAVLEEQLTNDKAAKYLNKILKGIKEQSRDIEITSLNLENKNAKVLMEIEAQKCLNEETDRLLEQLRQQQSLIDAEITHYEEEMKKSQVTIGKKQREIDILTKKIEFAQEKLGATEIPAEVIKVKALEKDIEDIQDKIKLLQKFWLQSQSHVVSLSHQRQNQIYEFNLLKKQMMILEQKNLKLTDEVDEYEMQASHLNHSINKLQNTMLILSDALNKKRTSKEKLDHGNDSAQFEFMGKLKDAELECIKLESEISEIEEEKLALSNELIERNRESLSWEKKVQMAIETKQTMDKEKGSTGEMGTMRAEVHRMHVRYTQLKRAQEKLIHDLEHCVSRRDAIITVNMAREKMTVGAAEKTRINFNRKLDDLRNKLKQLKDETELHQNMIRKEIEKQNKIKEDEEDLRKTIQLLNIKESDLEQAIEEAKSDKYLKIEMLVMKQKKLNMFSDIQKGRTPYTLYRTDSAISSEYDKQKILNGKLMTVLENLMSDLPNYYNEFRRLHNTLKLPAFVMLP